MAWIEKFIDNLAKLLKEPPYLLFVFIGAVFVIISLISQRYFDQTWMFFLYSIAGTMWRYIERDLIGKNFVGKILEEKEDENKGSKDFIQKPPYRRTIVTIYHIGNIGLFFALIHYLGFI